MIERLKHFKVLELPETLAANALYYVLNESGDVVQHYMTTDEEEPIAKPIGNTEEIEAVILAYVTDTVDTAIDAATASLMPLAYLDTASGGGGDSDVKVWSQKAANARMAAVAAAVAAALVDSSPAALNTLKEFATALGDDPNFATTITNALSAKAPLASPALTGVPTGPTQTALTRSTALATTEYVDAGIIDATPNAYSGPATAKRGCGYSGAAVGDLVVLVSTQWQKADATDETLSKGMLGISLQAAAEDTLMLAALPGCFVRDTAAFAPLSLDPGDTLYVSETAGGITTTKPTATDAVVRVIGWAIDSDTIYFMPSSDYITLA